LLQNLGNSSVEMTHNLSKSLRLKRCFQAAMGKKIPAKLSPSRNALALVVLWLLLTGTYGCGCLTGSSFTIGTGAAETGASSFEMGRVRSFQVARYDDVIEATRRAAEALSLEQKEEKIADNLTSFSYLDDKKTSIHITVERRSDSLSYIVIHTGLFGSKAMAIVIMKQIINELAEAGKYLEEWKHLYRI
jgi:hypothetical protein